MDYACIDFFKYLTLHPNLLKQISSSAKYNKHDNEDQSDSE